MNKFIGLLPVILIFLTMYVGGFALLSEVEAPGMVAAALFMSLIGGAFLAPLLVLATE